MRKTHLFLVAVVCLLVWPTPALTQDSDYMEPGIPEDDTAIWNDGLGFQKCFEIVETPTIAKVFLLNACTGDTWTYHDSQWHLVDWEKAVP